MTVVYTPAYTAQNLFKVQLALPIQPHDVGANGKISDRTYHCWLNEMRSALLQPWYQFAEPKETIVIAFTHLECSRSQPQQPHNRQPVGTMWLTDLGYTSCTFQAEIWFDRQLALTATQTGQLINPVTSRPIPIAEELRTAYWDYQWSL